MDTDAMAIRAEAALREKQVSCVHLESKPRKIKIYILFLFPFRHLWPRKIFQTWWPNMQQNKATKESVRKVRPSYIF